MFELIKIGDEIVDILLLILPFEILWVNGVYEMYVTNVNNVVGSVTIVF